MRIYTKVAPAALLKNEMRPSKSGLDKVRFGR
jgi:hypothetical protein